MKKYVLLSGIVLSFLLLLSPVFAAVGDLQVGIRSYDGYIPKNAVGIPFLTLQLSAEDEDALVSGVTIRRNGLSSYTDLERVWAMVDGKRSYNTRVLFNDLAIVRFRKPMTIAAGENKEVIVYGNMNSLGRGRTVYFSVEDIDSTAQNIYMYSLRSQAKTEEAAFSTTSRKKFRIECVDQKCRKIQQ